MILSRDLLLLCSQLKRKISSQAISESVRSLVILNASGKEFLILGAKKQKEFVLCRTMSQLRVRQRFSISSRRYVGDKSLRVLKV